MREPLLETHRLPAPPVETATNALRAALAQTGVEFTSVETHVEYHRFVIQRGSLTAMANGSELAEPPPQLFAPIGLRPISFGRRLVPQAVDYPWDHVGRFAIPADDTSPPLWLLLDAPYQHEVATYEPSWSPGRAELDQRLKRVVESTMRLDATSRGISLLRFSFAFDVQSEPLQLLVPFVWLRYRLREPGIGHYVANEREDGWYVAALAVDGRLLGEPWPVRGMRTGVGVALALAGIALLTIATLVWLLLQLFLP